MKDPRKRRFEELSYRTSDKRYMPHHHKANIDRCRGKQSYNTHHSAIKKRDQLLSRGFASFLRVYECPFAKHWHLTHQKPYGRNS